jgi:hypothetical protein
VTVLRTLVSSHLGLPVEQVHDRLALHRPHFPQESLLALAAALDLRFGVYVPPDSFGPQLTVHKLVELVLANAPESLASMRA